jgi:hypothetical protein
MPSPVNPPERPPDIPSDPNAILAHNLQNLIKLVRSCVSQNSDVPKFILKMYMAWYHSTLEALVAQPTLVPREDMDSFKNMHDDEMAVVINYLQDLFLKMQLRESLKQAGERKQSGV